MGNTFQELGKLDDAVSSYQKAISLNPNYVEAHNNLGHTLQKQGRLEEAITSFQRALALKPDITEARINLATIYTDLGRFDSAESVLSRVLEFEPEHPGAWAAKTGLRKMTSEDGQWLETALKLAADPNLTSEEMIAMQFAIGKYYDDTGQYDLAFPAFRQANVLRRQAAGEFNRAEFSRLIDALITIYNVAFMQRQTEEPNPSKLPTFIVGMPRSGTSLAEQIIASHPSAFGAGELNFLLERLDHAALLSESHDMDFIRGIAASYEEHLRRYSAEAIRIVDKMPSNFLRLGLIHAMFPQARIIHIMRNPIDTCLSIYFQNFLSSHAYATDLDDLAFYYCEYDRLMHHWRKVLPTDRFLEVPYESLIDNQAEWSRRIIEFIGLEWDERCLDFHETERKVGTSSNWQVRQKIYHSSKARWRNYEKHLGPLLSLVRDK
jgi:tetratricopeptide (TPR) repeat protein